MTPRTDQIQQAAPITRLTERVAYRNRFVTIFDDDVRFSDGRTGTYWRAVQASGLPGVAALPVAAGLIGLVRVYRYAVSDWEWGVPRGYAHGPDPAVSARAELLEELGAIPDGLVNLGQVTPDSAHLASVVHLFAATYPAPVAATRDTTEVAAVRWVPAAALQAEIVAGEIRDGYTLATACHAMCRGLLP